MATRDKSLTKPNERKIPYPYPSRYGTHKSMVVEQTDGVVVCEDEFGKYITSADRIDNGTADPNRFDHRRLCSTPWLTL